MKQDYKTKLLYKYFGITISLFITLFLYKVFHCSGLLIDTYEHIHASWLVGIGKVPYRDFFEHHNPLLWYLFSPITWVFYRDITIIYVALTLAVLGHLWILYLIFIIAKKHSNSAVGGLLSCLFLLCFPRLWCDILVFRPDIFMYIAIYAAVNYFFNYLDNHQLKYLCFSYFLWFLAFLFSQKATFIGIGFALANMWLVYKKELTVKDILKAAATPFFLILLLLCLLHHYNLLKDYYECNFAFNMIIKNYYGNYTFGLGKLPIFALILSFFVIRLCTFGNKENVLFILWLLSGISLLYFAPHAHYYFFFFTISAILLCPFLSQIYMKKYFLILALGVVFLSNSFVFLIHQKDSKHEISLINYVIKNTNPSDKLLNAHYSYNLFNLDTGYYWFGFQNVAILADLYTHKYFDYNEQIKKHKPKFLFLSDSNYDHVAFSNSKWLRSRNTALLQKAAIGDKTALSKLIMPTFDYWQIDMNYIREHYRYINKFGATELWQLID